jgi:hypothetical protein
VDNKAVDNDSWFYKHHQSVASDLPRRGHLLAI